MNNNISMRWNKRYQEDLQSEPQEIMPCSVLSEFGYLLPKKGLALDLACGLAGNAFYLAKHGLHVHAVDISQVAIDAVNNKAHEVGLEVEGVVRDIEAIGLADYQYDVIVVSYFLNRQLIPEIIQHLKQGGLLFYQTWSKEKVKEIGPKNADFLLGKGELLACCEGMNILHYHEEGLVGDLQKGFRSQAKVIALR